MANTLLNMIHSGEQAQQNSSGLPTSLDDPRMAEIKDMVNTKYNGNAKQAFLSLCKERMTDPATIISMLTGQR